MINLKKNDAIADAVRGIMEKELVGNQKKLDKNHNGKLDSQDFKMLRGQKKATEDVESVEENAFDYKSPRQPEPNGGSGVKKGSRYGGSKQKEKPEQEMPKEKNEEYVDEKFGGTQNMLNQTTHKSNDPMRRLKVTTDHPRFANKPLNSTSQNILKNRLKSAQGTHSKPNLPEETFTLKKMREKYEEPIIDEMINEVLSKDASAYDYIHDFVHSDNPKFAGKSKAERKKQALAAYYAKKNEEYVEEGMLKNAAKKAFKALTGGSDEDQRKDLQRKMGVPQTGKKPTKEEVTMESKGPTSQMDQPFVTDAENKPLNNAKELAAKTMKKMKSEMLGKAGTSE